MPGRISIKALFPKPSGSNCLEFSENLFSRVLDAKYLLNPEECAGLFLLTNFVLVPFRVLILKGTSLIMSLISNSMEYKMISDI